MMCNMFQLSFNSALCDINIFEDFMSLLRLKRSSEKEKYIFLFSLISTIFYFAH